MGHLGRAGLSVCMLCLFSIQAWSQPKAKNFPYETLIEKYIAPYELSPDNLFRLAAYAELKGEVASDAQSLTLEFGSLAKLSFYSRNCLLRTADNQVYHLDQRSRSATSTQLMNEVISSVFDHILLLANHQTDPEMIAFVDQALMKKNLEPFNKVYLRHILIKYGRFDQARQQVIFHTDWLPAHSQSYAYRSPSDISPIQRPAEPMQIHLSESVVRGYYLRSGGTVYIENVRRPISYATGEETSYNVSAFKLFVQQLFTQTTQYVVQAEKERIAQLPYQELPDFRARFTASTTPTPPAQSRQSYAQAAPLGVSRGEDSSPQAAPSSHQRRSKRLAAVKPLYSEHDWIPVMLGHLRARGISIGDPDIIQYFIDQPYFPDLYQRLSHSERGEVDRYLQRQR